MTTRHYRTVPLTFVAGLLVVYFVHDIHSVELPTEYVVSVVDPVPQASIKYQLGNTKESQDSSNPFSVADSRVNNLPYGDFYKDRVWASS